jgi:hypothetical protein
LVGALYIQRKEVEAAITHFGVRVCAEGTLPISAPSAPRELGFLHPKSPVLFTQSGTADVYGTFKGFRTKHISKVSPTTLCANLERRGYEQKWAPPLMNYLPFHNALADMTNPAVGFDKDLLQICRKKFVEHLMTNLSDDAKSCIHPFDTNTAINGVAGLAYCDKMNRQTSMGAPYCKSKKMFLTPVSAPENCDWVEFTPEIMERHQLMIDTYLSGTRFHAQFCAHLKDQAMTKVKAAAGKTRVFCSLEAAASLLMREMFLCVPMSVQNNKFVWNAAPGTIAQSLEWEELYLYVTEFGLDRIIAGDYAKYDKKVPASVMTEAFLVLLDIFERLGYSDDELAICWGLIMDVCFPTTDFGGDMIMFWGTNPSGHPLTVIINGIFGVLYILYTWEKSEYAHSNFFECCRLMTYGDDMFMGVHKSCTTFSHTFIAAELAKCGVDFTMADKTSESRPFIHIDECTFLKRSFVWDEDVGAILAPLEEDSITRSLMIATASRTICPKARDTQALSSACREYFFYGKAKFHEKRALFQQLVYECDLHAYVDETTFPSWDDLYQQFWKNSTHVVLSRRANEV